MSDTTDDIEQAFRERLDELEEIPSLPAVLPRLLSLLEQPETDASEVGEVLRMDPGLTAKVFKLINSSYYGLQREINSIQEAVTYIGFNTIRNLALTAGVIEKFTRYLSEHEGKIRLNFYELWKYSIATGIASETVGRHIRFPNHENAMASGILHRLGLVILQSHFKEYMDEIIQQQRENPGKLLRAERVVLGFDEQDIGLWLARKWDFPASIASGIGYHERPLELDPDDNSEHAQTIALLVNVGKNMAHKAGYHLSFERREPVLRKSVLNELDIDQQTMSILMDQFHKDLEDAQVFMEFIDKLEE